MRLLKLALNENENGCLCARAYGWHGENKTNYALAAPFPPSCLHLRFHRCAHFPFAAATPSPISRSLLHTTSTHLTAKAPLQQF